MNTRSLTEAAATTRLTQPAMSVSLKKLRTFFNDELVVYQRGEMRLTALALVLRPRIRQILQASREILDVAPAFDPMQDTGSFTLSAPDVVEHLFLGPLSRLMTQEAPAMRLISVPFTYQPVEVLFRQPLDVAVVAEPFAAPGFARERLFSETISCLVWNQSVYRDGMTEAQYFDGRHAGISHNREPLTHAVGAKLYETSERLNVVVRSSSYVSLPHLLPGTDLIVTALTSYAKVCAHLLPLKVVPIPTPSPTIDFVAQWQTYRDSEPGLRWFLSQLRRVAADRQKPLDATGQGQITA